MNTDGTNDFASSFKNWKGLKEQLFLSNFTELNIFLLDDIIVILFYAINFLMMKYVLLPQLYKIFKCEEKNENNFKMTHYSL